MDNFSTPDQETIARYPTADGFSTFCSSFQSMCQDLGVDVNAQDFLSAATIPVAKDLISDLTFAVISQPACRILSSRNGLRSLREDLAGVLNLIGSKKFDLTSTVPLVNHVIKHAPDVDIWNAVFGLVASTSPKAIEIPTIYWNSVPQTPILSNSASQMESEQKYRQVDMLIVAELEGRVYCNVAGFFERYFENKDWTNKASDLYEKSQGQHTNNSWTGWPDPPIEDRFLNWFMKFQDSVLRLPDGVGKNKYYTSAERALTGSQAKRKLDLFLAREPKLPGSQHDWSNVLVIGEHKQNPKADAAADTLVQLAGYAREVFGSQPERRFVPGFTICGKTMRLWVFDRSGAYSSNGFDIHEQPERFVKVLAGYAMMSDPELGLNTFIKHDDIGKFIIAKEVKFYIEDSPIFSTRAIVCRGTTCYRGRRSDSTDWKYVIKFTWPSDKRQREGELLKSAKQKGVTGIAIWFYHQQITLDSEPDSISHFRRDMKFGPVKRLSNTASCLNSTPENSVYSSTSLGEIGGPRAMGLRTGAMSAATSSGQKRKRDERSHGVSRPKRSDGIGESSTALGSIQGSVVDILADCRNGWERNDVNDAQEAGAESEIYENRVHYCLVTSPAGRALRDYQSVRELLEALRDAIQGHRSLLEDGNILHRDVSLDNIIITERPAEGAPKGILIDLDLAKELGSMRSRAYPRTGTMQFMAIEVLQGKGHTYRHDLESFFYVFVWICILCGRDGTRKKPDILQLWYTGKYTEIARTKVGDMTKNQFEIMMVQFAPEFEKLKPLARELRSTLFPFLNGDIFLGTLDKAHIMYDGMIAAFDKAIGLLVNERPGEGGLGRDKRIV